MAPTDKSQNNDESQNSDVKNVLNKTIKPHQVKKKEDDVVETKPMQTEPSQTGIIPITENPNKGLIRIFRFKLLVAACQKNTAYKDGEIDLKDVEHVHWFRTHDSRTGIKHERVTLACGHSHPITIAYKIGPLMKTVIKRVEDKKTKQVNEVSELAPTGENGIVGIDLDNCKVGPSIREVSIGALNSKKRIKKWMAVLLGTLDGQDENLRPISKDIYDEHSHSLEYIDYEDIDLNKARAARSQS